METETKHINWTRLAITTGIVFLTALIVGGTTWYLMDKNGKSAIISSEQALTKLQNEISTLRAENETDKKPTSTQLTFKYNNDYQAIVSLATKDRSLSKVGNEEIRVEAIRDGWALVKFTPYPLGTSFSDGLIVKKLGETWETVAIIDSSGNLNMKDGYKQSDIPGSIYQ